MASTIAVGRDQTLDFAIDIQGLGADLPEKLDRMREADPIFWSAQNQAWIVTGHRQVVEGYYGKLPLSSVRLPFLAVTHLSEEDKATKIPHLMEAPKTWLLNMDDPEHQRMRRLMVKAFSKPVVEAIRPYVRQYIQEALDDVAAIDGPFDFVQKVARIIPARMILRQFGLDDTLIAKLHRWSVLMNLTGNINVPLPQLIEVDALLVELRELFQPEFDKRREQPIDDFLSALVTATEDGHSLSNDEMFGICVITLIAGHDTTANTISLAINELANDPVAVEAMRTGPMNLDAIMELQRTSKMSTLMSRVVAEDFDWEGHAMKAGQFVLLSQLAANRDPAVYPDPDRFDATRKAIPNMTFAPGVHHCIGHLLAKMVLSEFFPAFLGRFDWEVLDSDLDFAPTMAFRGLDSLTVRLHPRLAVAA
jgi:cytochrome P450